MSGRGGDLLLGIDVGTTHTKAVLARASGSVLHVARRPTPTTRHPKGGATHPIAALLAVVDDAVREAVDVGTAGRAEDRVVGIGIASMAEAGALVDAGGTSVGDAMAWHDARPSAEMAAVADAMGAAELFRRTGLRPEPKYSLAKILWLRRATTPSRLGTGWASIADLVAAALTGRLVTNRSLACRTMLWNLGREAWDEELLELAGLEAAAMPLVEPPNAASARLISSAAHRLGVPHGIPVVVAGHDHPVGAVGAGVTSSGNVLDSLGTAEAVLMVTNRPVLDEAVRLGGYSTGAFPLPDRFYLIAGLPTAGAAVDALVRGYPPYENGYATFDDLVAAATWPSGLVIDPAMLEAPSDAGAGANPALAQLVARHGLATVALAVLEAIAVRVRSMLAGLETLAGRSIERVTLTGAASGSEQVRRLRAAIAPWPLEASASPEAVALGAALIAGLAAGVFPDEAALLRAASPAVAIPRAEDLAAAYAAAPSETPLRR